MRGLDISAVGIIAFLAILMMAGYLITQAGSGTQRAGQSVRYTEIGHGVEILENAKEAVNQDLKFSASQASIIVAAQGGSIFPGYYWMCNQDVTVPQPDEVVFALSNISSGIMKGYINSTTQFRNVTLRGYSCVGMFDPGKQACLGKSSASCEGFATSADKGEIKVKRDENFSYTGRLEADMTRNRFWWIYHNLREFFETDGFRNAIKQQIADSENCENPTEQDLEIALEEACQRVRDLFDEYVIVDCETVCKARDASCLNEDCRAPEIDTSVCFEPRISSEPESFMYGQGQYNNRISVQSAGLGSATVRVSVKDTKYNIAGPEGRLIPLVWNLRLVFDMQEALCVVIK